MWWRRQRQRQQRVPEVAHPHATSAPRPFHGSQGSGPVAEQVWGVYAPWVEARTSPKRQGFFFCLGDEPLRRWLLPTAIGWRLTAVSCSSSSISVGGLVGPPVWDKFFCSVFLAVGDVLRMPLQGSSFQHQSGRDSFHSPSPGGQTEAGRSRSPHGHSGARAPGP